MLELFLVIISEKASKANGQSSEKQKSQKSFEPSKDIATTHQQTPWYSATKEGFRPYYGEVKYCHISLDPGHTIKRCPLMLPEVWTGFQEKSKNNETKIRVEGLGTV